MKIRWRGWFAFDGGDAEGEEGESQARSVACAMYALEK